MLDLWIVVEAQAELSTTVSSMLSAFQAAIINSPGSESTSVTVLSPQTARDRLEKSANHQGADQNLLICPFTLNLPENISFQGKDIYQACQDVIGLRTKVVQMGYQTGNGQLWLPVVLTAKGPLYGEAIALGEGSLPTQIELDLGSSEWKYTQPWHLSDATRQDLYKLAYRLLRSLNAPPATYLLQFGVADQIYFDRLWPFPAPPAIASIGVQQPNLFVCHWYCLQALPLVDLQIIP